MPIRELQLPPSTDLLCRQAQALRGQAALLVKESEQICQESLAVLRKVEATLDPIQGTRRRL